MDDYDDAIEIMGELGDLLEPDAIFFYPDQATWSVIVNNETTVDISYDPVARVLIFILDLGSIPEPVEAEIHKILLRFSYLWRETGGIHGAIDAEGRAALMYKRPLARLDTQSLRSLISNLAIQRGLWADLINAPPKQRKTDAPIGTGFPFGGIPA